MASNYERAVTDAKFGILMADACEGTMTRALYRILDIAAQYEEAFLGPENCDPPPPGG